MPSCSRGPVMPAKQFAATLSLQGSRLVIVATTLSVACRREDRSSR